MTTQEQRIRSLAAVAAYLLATNVAIAAPLLWIGDAAGNLGTVDVATGATNVIGNLGYTPVDIAFDPDGALFGISDAGDLYRINTVDASSALIGSTGIFTNSLVFNRDGTLYTAGGSLYTLDPNTAAATLVGFGGVPYSSSGDLAFIGDDLFLTDSVLLQNGLIQERLVRLDPATGSGTVISALGTLDALTLESTGFVGLYGLASPNGIDLYGVPFPDSEAQGSIIRIDPQTGAASLVINYGPDLLGSNGAAFLSEAQVVPAPAAGTLALTSLAGLVGTRFRRRLRRANRRPAAA